jgi:hypothetical protein
MIEADTFEILVQTTVSNAKKHHRIHHPSPRARLLPLL